MFIYRRNVSPVCVTQCMDQRLTFVLTVKYFVFTFEVLHRHIQAVYGLCKAGFTALFLGNSQALLLALLFALQ